VRSHDSPSIDPEVHTELLARARAAADQAYVPYSGFPVGAAVLGADGSIHTGCNVENASYGLTICAERVAATAAVSSGHREIIAVAVSAPKVPRTTPCGACRQFLNEFQPGDCDMVIILDDRGSGEPVWLGELLPHAFGPRNFDAALTSDMNSTLGHENHGG
jgi:cytidine deaminase